MSKFFKKPGESTSSSEEKDKPIISLEAEFGEESESEGSDSPIASFPAGAEDIHDPCSRFANDFVRKDPHGHGFYGQVFVCEHRIDQNKYAAKRITAEDGVKLPFEIFALSRMSNTNIVRFYQVWKEPYVQTDCTSSSEENSLVAANRTNKPYCYYILMEFCPRTLSELWDEMEEVDVEKAWDIFTQLAEGISFIHKEGYIHCDIKPKNVLLDMKETVKICDFGLGRFQDGREVKSVSVKAVDPDFLANRVYRAPELLDKESITEKVDIYSMGVIAVDIFHRTRTLTNLESLEMKKVFVETKKLPDIFKNEDARIRNLLVSMIDVNPACRPSAETVLSVLALRKESLQSPVVILVRATRFIASAVSHPLLKAGCKVLVNFGTEVNPEDTEDVLNKLISNGYQAYKFVNDLSTKKDVESMIETAVVAWGTIDVLINNAGDGTATHLDLTPLSDHVSCCTKAVAEIMMKKKKGTIIYMSDSNLIEKVTQAAAELYANSSITVNAIIGRFICGGPSGNFNAPCERPWELEEVASIMEMLMLGSAAKYITGHVFRKT